MWRTLKRSGIDKCKLCGEQWEHAKTTGRLYNTDDDFENAKVAGQAFVDQLPHLTRLGWVSPNDPASLRFYDLHGLSAVGKAITRGSMAWAQFEDYAISEKRWRGIQEVGDKLHLPAFLIVTTRAHRGYVRVHSAALIPRPPDARGARGVKSRGDRRDDEAMVHVAWEMFTPMLPPRARKLAVAAAADPQATLDL